MKITATALPEVKLIEPRRFDDARGFFAETWSARGFADARLPDFVQDNHSRSGKGVLRGLHYQIEQAQGKLVRVASGRAFDVAVDLRRSSPRFGKWVGVELSGDDMRMLWIPPGFAHGFLSLEDDTDLIYKCTDYYAPAHERTLLWSDPALAIAWPLDRTGKPLLSDKDLAGLSLGSADLYP